MKNRTKHEPKILGYFPSRKYSAARICCLWRPSAVPIIQQNSTNIQGSRSWGFGGSWPPENMYEGSEYVLTPLKCQILSFKTVVVYGNCKFHSIKDEQLDTITSLILLMLTMLPYVWSASSRQCPPVNAVAAILGFKVIVAQDKSPKHGCRWPAVDNPHRWCTSWRSRGVHLPWQ